MPVGLVHPLDRERIAASAGAAARTRRRPRARPCSARPPSTFLPSCLRSAFSISPRSMLEQLREHAVVDHVLDEAAQLGVRADRRRRSCRTAPDRTSGRSRSVVELERLVVEHGARPARATARLPSPSRRSSRRGSRLPSCGRCSRPCWRGWCTRSAGRRCSTGTCSCPTPGCPSGRWSAGGRGWPSGCPTR